MQDDIMEEEKRWEDPMSYTQKHQDKNPLTPVTTTPMNDPMNSDCIKLETLAAAADGSSSNNNSSSSNLSNHTSLTATSNSTSSSGTAGTATTQGIEIPGVDSVWLEQQRTRLVELHHRRILAEQAWKTLIQQREELDHQFNHAYLADDLYDARRRELSKNTQLAVDIMTATLQEQNLVTEQIIGQAAQNGSGGVPTTQTV